MLEWEIFNINMGMFPLALQVYLNWGIIEKTVIRMMFVSMGPEGSFGFWVARKTLS